jgi:hypothetical protein
MQIMNNDNVPSTDEMVWSGRYSYAAQFKIQETIRILSHLDAQHNLELDGIQRHLADGPTQENAVQKLKAAHRKRREPYVRQLEELRQQRPQPFIS